MKYVYKYDLRTNIDLKPYAPDVMYECGYIYELHERYRVNKPVQTNPACHTVIAYDTWTHTYQNIHIVDYVGRNTDCHNYMATYVIAINRRVHAPKSDVWLVEDENKSIKINYSIRYTRYLDLNCIHNFNMELDDFITCNNWIKQNVFVKHYAPNCNKVWKSYFFKCKDQSQGHNVIHISDIQKGIISEVFMSNMKSLPFLVQNL